MTGNDRSSIGCDEVERAVLGAFMLGDRRASALAATLEEFDFTSQAARDTLTAVQSLVTRGEPVDPVTVLGEIRRTGKRPSTTCDVPWAVYLAELQAATPVAASTSWYIRVLLEHRLRRAVQDAAARFVQAAERSSTTRLAEVVAHELEEIDSQFARISSPPCEQLERLVT